MNLRPYLSHNGPPMIAPAADPNALALTAARSPRAKLSNPNSFCHRAELVAMAMIEPASM